MDFLSLWKWPYSWGVQINGAWLQTRKYYLNSSYYQAFKAVSLESSRSVFDRIFTIYFRLL